MIWLIVACLSVVLLPDMIMTIKPLSDGLTWVVNLTAAGIGFLFFLWSVYTRYGKASDDADKKIEIPAYLLGAFPCLLVYLVFVYGSHSVTPVLAAISMVNKGLFIGIMVVLVIGLLLLPGIPFFTWMNRCRKAPVVHPVRRFFTRFPLGMALSFLLWAALFTPSLGLVFVQKIWAEPGMIIRHLTLLVGAFIMAGFLNGAMVLAEKMTAGAETLTETKEKSFGKRYLPELLALALCILLALSQNFTQLTKNEPAMLEAQLKDSLVEYGLYLATFDANGAIRIAGDAADKMDRALMACEDAIKEADGDAAIKKAEKRKKAFQKVCDKYEIFRTDGQALTLFEQYKRQGGADKQLVQDILDLSEEYPDRLWIQYTAATIGSSFTYDEAKHYDRTAKAVLRCLELYLQEQKQNEEERLAFKMNMANMLVAVYHEEDAIGILEALADTGYHDAAEINELLARCYERTGQLKEAYELASLYCEKHTDSPYLMYYAALSALKLEKREECIKYTSALASYTADCEDETLNDCDTWLFGLLEFLTLNDDRLYTEFQYNLYKDLTEEENALIDANPFFRNYLDAVYLAYHSGHKDAAEEAFGKIEAVLTENPKLASAWYLCGIIASNNKEAVDEEEAITYYQVAGDLNDKIPAVWYAMAREYDRLGEYEKGIETCKKALALLPEQDHGSDWYGINYHCSRLLRALENAVKK